MALENFVEMRDKSADWGFIAAKRLESLLENHFPNRFRSRYAMLCNGGAGNVSYANAFKLGPVQDTILNQIVGTDSQLDLALQNVDLNQASHLIDECLVPLLKALEMDLSLTLSELVRVHRHGA